MRTVARGPAARCRASSTTRSLRASIIRSSAVGNVRFTWRGKDDQWQASAEVMNVTDKLYYLATNDYSASAGSSSYAPALPRTWAISIKRKFD